MFPLLLQLSRIHIKQLSCCFQEDLAVRELVPLVNPSQLAADLLKLIDALGRHHAMEAGCV